MKFIFSILAILVCFGAVYFTLTESEKFEKTQEERLVAISTNQTVTRTSDALEAENEKLQAQLDTAKEELEVAIQNNSALESDGNALKNDVSKLDGELASQNVELKELANTMKEVEKIFADLGDADGDINIDNLGDKVTEIEDNIKAKRSKVEELDTLIEGAKSSLTAKQSEVQRLVERKQARNRRIDQNSMEARVTAVNQDWGFLVIGAGSNSGFTPQTALLVKRDGRLIGRVNPSAIELNQTIADIDLKSLSSGVRIQPGDRVILAKPAGN